MQTMTSFASTLMIMFWTGGSADIAVQKYFRCQRFAKDRCQLMVKIFRDKVCAYNPKWDTDTCQGDSGSGLVVGASSGQSPVLVCRWDFLLLLLTGALYVVLNVFRCGSISCTDDRMSLTH